MLIMVGVVPACGRVGFDPSSAREDSGTPGDSAVAADTQVDGGDAGDAGDAGETGPADTGAPDAASPWWDSRWLFRKALVVNPSQVFEDLTGFPVLVDLTDADVAANARPGGDSLIFTDAAGTALPHELELFAGGRLVAWVRLPAVAADAETVFYLYYGGPAASGAVDPAVLWNNGFIGVYHFGDGSTLDVGDATGRNSGTNNGATAAPGQVLGAASFGGGPNIRVETVGANVGAGEYNTVSFWMNYTGPLQKALFAFFDGAEGYDLWFFSNTCFGFNTEGGDVLGTTQTGLSDRWVHVAAVFYNGVPSAAENVLYIDGIAQTLTTCAGGTANSRAAKTSAYWASANGYQFTGLLDEGRISNVVRSPGWIRTEFENQNTPGTFISAGAEENAPSGS